MVATRVHPPSYLNSSTLYFSHLFAVTFFMKLSFCGNCLDKILTLFNFKLKMKIPFLFFFLLVALILFSISLFLIWQKPSAAIPTLYEVLRCKTANRVTALLYWSSTTHQCPGCWRSGRGHQTLHSCCSLLEWRWRSDVQNKSHCQQ